MGQAGTKVQRNAKRYRFSMSLVYIIVIYDMIKCFAKYEKCKLFIWLRAYICHAVYLELYNV